VDVFGEVLRTVLDKKGIHHQDIATALGKTESAVSHLISGRTKSVDDLTSARISQVLGTPETFWSELKSAEKQRAARPAPYYLRALGYAVEPVVKAGILVDYQVVGIIERWKDVEEDAYTDDTLVIEPFNSSDMKATGYDTHIGGVWSGPPKTSVPRRLQDDELLTIQPGETAYVHSREHFRMPVDIVGRIGPTVDLITCGVNVSHGPLVAPLYCGKLTVALHNFTSEPVSISQKTRFIKVVFEKLQAIPETREKLMGLDTQRKLEQDKAFLQQEEQRTLAELDAIRQAIAQADR